jgi:phenylacetate-CoA ligase
MKRKMKISKVNVTRNILESFFTRWGGRKKIEEKQLSHLRKKVESARTSSPLFRQLYKDLPPSNQIHLNNLPITYKKELMKDFNTWIAGGAITKEEALEHMSDMEKIGIPLKNNAVVRTSGTSGEPLIRIIPASVPEAVAGFIPSHVDRRGRKLAIKLLIGFLKRGSAVMIMGGRGHFAGTSMTQMMDGQASKILGTNFIAAEKPIDDIVKKLNSLGNVIQITTYPSMLSILTKEKEAERLKIEPVLIKLAGETLTKELREKATKAFKNVVIQNAYACSESPTISLECMNNRFHVPEDWIIIEAIDENEKPIKDGEISDAILLSNLYDDIQPFIRYKMSDRIKFFTDKCPCGSPFKSFEIKGREATILRIGDRTLSALTMGLEFDEASRVQLVQVSEYKFEARADIKEGVDKKSISTRIIHDAQKFFLDQNIQGVLVEWSNKPPELGASGKFHEVIPLKKEKNE